jgi:hypothetical protein
MATHSAETPGTPGTKPRKERRANIRVPVRVALSLLCIGRKTYGWAVNISPGGIYVEADEQFPVGARVEVDSLLALEDAVHHLKAEGRVVHTHGKGMGVEFVNLSPHSLLFIRRLVNHFIYNDRR